MAVIDTYETNPVTIDGRRIQLVGLIGGTSGEFVEITGQALNVTNVQQNFTNGALDVAIQDQQTPVVDFHLTQPVQDLSLEVDSAEDDLIVTVSSIAEPTVGSMIEFYEGSRFFQAHIMAVNANVAFWDVTMDTPLDFDYTAADSTLKEVNDDMATNGAVTSKIFTASPQYLADGQYWDITRITMQMTHSASGDDGKFAGIAALTNGIVLRKKNGLSDSFFNAKSNGDLALHTGGDVTYTTRSGGNGAYGTRARRTFSGQEKNGVTVRLGSSENGQFQIIIQDDLSTLDSFQAVVQGHVVE